MFTGKNSSFLYAPLGINLLNALVILATLRYLPPNVPLFYGLPIGASQLVKYYYLFLVPIIGVVITLINYIVSIKIADKYLKDVLFYAAVFASVLGAITVLKIILLVGFF